MTVNYRWWWLIACVVVCQGPQWVLLTDAEVKERFVVIEERKKRIIENKLRAQLREEKRQKSEELQSKLAEARLHRKLEQQGCLSFHLKQFSKITLCSIAVKSFKNSKC